MPEPVLARLLQPRRQPLGRRRHATRSKALRPEAWARRALLAAVAVWVLLSPAASHASIFCDVRKTGDGFLALRAAPDPKARLIARMHAGDEVLVRDDVAARGGWVFVTWWKGGRFKVKRDSGYDPSDADGWMRETLLADECG